MLPCALLNNSSLVYKPESDSLAYNLHSRIYPNASRNAKLSPGDVAALAKGVGGKKERECITLQKSEQWLLYIKMAGWNIKYKIEFQEIR